MTDHMDEVLTSLALRQKWFTQAIECIDYIHTRGVIHCDMRPENFLIDGDTMDLRLCDFGHSECTELGIKGSLPDDGFCDPAAEMQP